MAALAFLMGLPMLFSFTVFQAILSISSVGLYASCARPLCAPLQLKSSEVVLSLHVPPLLIVQLLWASSMKFHVMAGDFLGLHAARP
jgi:hypothetical protein